MTKIITLQQDKRPVIVEDSWLVLRPELDDNNQSGHVSHDAVAAAAAQPGKVLFPLHAWEAHRDGLLAQRKPEDTGVWLAPDDDPLALEGQFDRLGLVAIDFPVFRDGRGYSSAYLLRTRLKYDGALRAIGDVLRDQLNAMRRCGFDSFAVRADKNIEDALKGFSELTVQYQGTLDEPLPLFRRARTVAGAQERV